MTNDYEARRRRVARTGRRRFGCVTILVAVAVGGGGAFLLLRDTPERLYRQARQVQDSDPTRALQLAAESVEAAEGEFPQARLLWSRLLARAGRWHEAVGCFSLIQDPTECHPGELVQLARHAQSADVPLLAEMALDAALKTDAIGDEPRRSRGHGQEQPARRGPSHSTSSQPSREDVLKLLIPLKFEFGKLDAVLELCSRLKDLQPDDPFAYRVAANVHQERQEPWRAISLYQQALERRPPEHEIHEVRRQLLSLYLDVGDAGSARLQFEQLRAATQLTSADRIKQAYLLRLEGRSDAALELIERQTVDSASVPARMVRGILRFDRQEYEQAVEDLKFVVKMQPFNKEAHYKLAQSYLRTEQAELAEKHFKTSRRLTDLKLRILELQSQLDRKPDSVELRFELAKLYNQAGQHDRAAKWRNSARRLEQSRATADGFHQ